jgi:glycosyltransferase involved in cell wall biosynthesis
VRILFATQVPLDRGHGGSRHVSAVARELARLGHAITLLAPGNDAPPAGVERLRPPSGLAPGARLEAALAMLATRRLAAERFDAAYVRLSASSLFLPLAIAARRVPLVVELNGRILDELRELGRPRWMIRLVEKSLRTVVRRACRLVAVEPGIARHAETALRAARVVVIENGADLDAAIPGDRDAARRALGLDLDRRYVAFTGTLVPEQRFDLLLEAQRRLGSFTLLIAGAGSQAGLLGAAARTAPIVLLGAVPHDTAIQAIRAADVCVNVRDGDLGMKCFEYAAVGRRIVAFRIAGAERLEALYPGLDAVHLVDERSAGGVARALEAALAAEGRLGALPPSAVTAARGTIGWEHAARRIAAVLTACVEDRSRQLDP